MVNNVVKSFISETELLSSEFDGEVSFFKVLDEEVSDSSEEEDISNNSFSEAHTYSDIVKKVRKAVYAIKVSGLKLDQLN